jgi:hypothetical protein
MDAPLGVLVINANEFNVELVKTLEVLALKTLNFYLALQIFTCLKITRPAVERDVRCVSGLILILAANVYLGMSSLGTIVL